MVLFHRTTPGGSYSSLFLLVGLLASLFCLTFFFHPTAIQAQETQQAQEGTSAEVFYSEAVNHFIDEEYDLALDRVRRALDEDPDHTQAQQLRETLEELVDLPEDEAAEEAEEELGELADREDPNDIQLGSVQNPAEVRPDSPFATVDDQEAPKEPPEIQAEPSEVIRHVRTDYDQPEGRTRAVYGVEAREYPDRVRISIRGSRSLDYVVSEIFDPAMLVIDIPNALNALPDPPLPIELKDVIRVRHSQYRVDPINTTRVVLDLEQWHDNFQIYRDTPGNRVVIDIFDVEEIFPGADEDPEIEDIFRQVHPDLYYQLQRVEGHGQSLGIPRETSDPMIAEFVDEDGEPLDDERVEVSVRHGDVELGESPDEFQGESLELRTDEDGRVRFHARSKETSGPVEIVASVEEYDLLVNYRLEVEAAEPVDIQTVAGDRQETLFGERPPNPMMVEVQDRFGNPVPDVMVTFKSLTRGAFLDVNEVQPGLSRRQETNDDGRVEVDVYRIAPDREVNEVRASLLEIEGEPSTTFTIFGRPNVISVSLQDAPLSDVLRTLAEISNINLVLQELEADDEQRSVTVHLEDVTPLRAMDTILETQGFARVMDEDVVTVVAREEAIQRGVYEGFEYRVIELEHEALSINNDDLADRLRSDLPLGEQGRIISHPRTNEIVVYGETAMVERVVELVEIMDQPGRLQENFRFIDMEGFDAEQIAAQVNRILGMDITTGVNIGDLTFTDPDPDEIRQIIQEERQVNIEQLLERGQIIAIPELQQILIFGSPDLLDTAEAMIERIQEMGLDYMDRQKFEWYQAENIPFEQTQSLINRMGNVQTFSTIEYLDAFLLSSPEQEALESALNQLNQIDSSDLSSFSYDLIEIERADPSVVLEKLNQIIGVAEDVDETEEVFFFAPQEETEGTDAANLEEVVTQMNAIILEETDTIMLIGPSNFRSFAREIIQEIEDSYVELEDYYWEWYPAQVLGVERVNSFVGRFPGVDVETAIPERNLLLLRSSTKEEIDEFREIMSRLDSTEIDQSGREIVVYSPQFVDVSTLVGELEEYFQNIDDTLERERALPRVVYSDELRAVFSLQPSDASMLREIIQKLDSNAFFDHSVITYFPTNLDAEDLEDQLDELQYATLLHVTPDRISLLVPSNRQDETRQFLEQIDKSGYTIGHVELNYRRAHDVVDVISGLLDDDAERGALPSPEGPTDGPEDLVTRTSEVVEDLNINVSLTADPDLNRVVFATPRNNRSMVRDLIKQFDVRAKQVYVEGVLAEYDLEEGFEFNPFWNYLNEDLRVEFGSDPPTGPSPGGPDVSADPALPQFADRVFTGLFQQEDLQVILDFLEEDLDGEIVARPQISTLNNEQGVIRLEETRFAEETEVSEGGVVTTTLTEVVAETVLEISPTITKSRDVLLNLNIINEIFVSPQEETLTTESRSSQSKLYVEDGQTIVVGGLIQDDVEIQETGVPFLRHIPVLGHAFSSYSEDVVQNELVVFLTPHVMEEAEEVDRLAEERIGEEAQFSSGLSVNVNTDSFQQLERLFSLSDASDPAQLAAAADDYRRNAGPFTSLSDLLRLPGVDPLVLEQIMDRVELSIPVNSATPRQLSRVRHIDAQIATDLSHERDLRIRFEDFDVVRNLLIDRGVDSDYIDSVLQEVMVLDSGESRTQAETVPSGENYDPSGDRAEASSANDGEDITPRTAANVEEGLESDTSDNGEIERDVNVTVERDTQTESNR